MPHLEGALTPVRARGQSWGAWWGHPSYSPEAPQPALARSTAQAHALPGLCAASSHTASDHVPVQTQTSRLYTGGAAWHRDQPQPRILGCRDAECILTGRKAKGTAALRRVRVSRLQPKSDQVFRSKGNMGGGRGAGALS